MFTAFIATLPSTLEQGLIYAILALGIMLTYSILDFPDLTVDGSFPLGEPSPSPCCKQAMGRSRPFWRPWRQARWRACARV